MSKTFICDEWYIDDEKAYFLSIWGNELFEIDLIQNTICYLSKIPEKEVSFRSYNKCIKRGNMIFCFPDIGKNIWKYDLEKKVWHCIGLDIFDSVRAELTVCSVRDYSAILFSEGLRALIIFDMEKECLVSVNKLGIDSKVALGRKVVLDDYLYISELDRPILHFVNYFTGETDGYSVPGISKGFLAFSRIGDDFWLSSSDNKIHRWTIGSSETVDCLFPEGYKSFESDKHPGVFDIVHQSGKLFFLPYNSNMICYLDPKETEIKEIIIEEKECNRILTEQSKTCMVVYCDETGNVFFCSERESGFFRISTDECSVSTLRIQLDKECFEHFFSETPREEDFVLDTSDFIGGFLK